MSDCFFVAIEYILHISFHKIHRKSGKWIQLISRSVEIMDQQVNKSVLDRQTDQPVSLSLTDRLTIYIYIYIYIYRLWWYWSIARYRHELRDSVASHSLRTLAMRDAWIGSEELVMIDVSMLAPPLCLTTLRVQLYLKKSQRAHVKWTQWTHV